MCVGGQFFFFTKSATIQKVKFAINIPNKININYDDKR